MLLRLSLATQECDDGCDLVEKLIEHDNFEDDLDDVEIEKMMILTMPMRMMIMMTDTG